MLTRTGQYPCNIHGVARACGVTLHDGAENRTSGRVSGHCYCKPTVRTIGRAHGEAHLALVLRLINETGNGLELHATTIKAVSDVVLSDLVEVGSGLFDAFDQIDLGRLRGAATALPGPTRVTMAGMLLALLSEPAIAIRAA